LCKGLKGKSINTSGTHERPPSLAKWFFFERGRTYSFDVNKMEQNFDLLLKDKQVTFSERHVAPSLEKLADRPYCKWHNSFSQ